MRALIQRVKHASVTINEKQIASISTGILALIGLHKDDTEKEFEWMLKKITNLRIFPGEKDDGRFDKSLLDMGGELLFVSQFTLYANCRKGSRPSFSEAMPPAQARKLYEKFLTYCKQRLPIPVSDGEFGANMDVELLNSGPVTIMLEST